MADVRTIESNSVDITAIVRLKHGKLYAFLQEKGWTQKQLADELGAEASIVGRWVNLRQRPSKRFHRQLERLTGYLIEELFPDWFKPSDIERNVNTTTRAFTEADIKALQIEKQVNVLSLEENYEREYTNETVRLFIDKFLNTREAEILKRRYGIGSYSPQSWMEIGQAFNVSGERVRKIAEQGMKKIQVQRKKNPRLSSEA